MVIAIKVHANKVYYCTAGHMSFRNSCKSNLSSSLPSQYQLKEGISQECELLKIFSFLWIPDLIKCYSFIFQREIKDVMYVTFNKDSF